MLEAKEIAIDSKSSALEYGRKMTRRVYQSENERFQFWKRFSDNKAQLEETKQQVLREEQRLRQIHAEAAEIRKAKTEMLKNIEEMKKELPSGE